MWFSSSSSNLNKIQIFFFFWRGGGGLTKTLTLLLPVPCYGGDTVLPINSRMCFKRYLVSFLKVCRLMDFAFVVFKLLMFKLCRIICISKIEFFNFSGTERLNICPKKPKKTSLWKNGDVIMDFDPLHLGNHTLLAHSSQETFDQHWIAVPTVYRMTRFRRKHFAAEKMPMSAPMWLCKVSLLKKIFLVTLQFYTFITNWSISQKLWRPSLNRP